MGVVRWLMIVAGATLGLVGYVVLIAGAVLPGALIFAGGMIEIALGVRLRRRDRFAYVVATAGTAASSGWAWIGLNPVFGASCLVVTAIMLSACRQYVPLQRAGARL
jgi:hypothetical protein